MPTESFTLTSLFSGAKRPVSDKETGLGVCIHQIAGTVLISLYKKRRAGFGTNFVPQGAKGCRGFKGPFPPPLRIKTLGQLRMPDCCRTLAQQLFTVNDYCWRRKNSPTAALRLKAYGFDLGKHASLFDNCAPCLSALFAEASGLILFAKASLVKFDAIKP